MSTAEQPLLDVLRSILGAIVPLLKELPNRCDVSHCFDLEDLPDRVMCGMQCGKPRHLQHELLSEAGRLIEKDRKDEPVESVEELRTKELRTKKLRTLMCELTGTWLGLYFLGTPFPHPWEPVARHAERHGYDRDGGVFKAAGDVYRSARRALTSDAKRGTAEPLMLLDLGPLAYMKFTERGTTGGADLPAIVSALGACYEMLQLRLYIRAGGPIVHVIMEDTLRALVHKDADNIEKMVALANKAYGSLPAESSDQRIIIAKPNPTAPKPDPYNQLSQMPGSVLGPKDGVYRSRLTIDGGANGNRLTDAQLVLYRSTLCDAVDSGLTIGDEARLRAYLNDL